MSLKSATWTSKIQNSWMVILAIVRSPAQRQVGQPYSERASLPSTLDLSVIKTPQA
jgi:hypothetical protein